MNPHLIDGKFQSDKYPTCPRGKVPLSCEDPTAQDLLATYAQRRRSVDAEFSDGLEEALRLAGYEVPKDKAVTIKVVETNGRVDATELWRIYHARQLSLHNCFLLVSNSDSDHCFLMVDAPYRSALEVTSRIRAIVQADWTPGK